MKWYLSLLTLFLLGCSQVDDANVVGIYEYRAGALKQQLEVLTEGRYKNVLYDGSTVIWLDQGTWIYEDVAGEKGMTFAKFKNGFLGYSDPPSRDGVELF